MKDKMVPITYLVRRDDPGYYILTIDTNDSHKTDIHKIVINTKKNSFGWLGFLENSFRIYSDNPSTCFVLTDPVYPGTHDTLSARKLNAIIRNVTENPNARYMYP